MGDRFAVMPFVLARSNLVEMSSASQGFLGLLKLASRSDQRFQETLPWSEREDFLMCDLAESLLPGLFGSSHFVRIFETIRNKYDVFPFLASTLLPFFRWTSTRCLGCLNFDTCL